MCTYILNHGRACRVAHKDGVMIVRQGGIGEKEKVNESAEKRGLKGTGASGGGTRREG